jgi:ABC-type nitrate/sulfonate/bicarbonate transport system permease component
MLLEERSSNTRWAGELFLRLLKFYGKLPMALNDMKENGAKGRARFLPWILPLGCLLLWFAASGSGAVPSYQLPGPLDVGVTGYRYIFGTPGEAPFAGRFPDDVLASLMRVGAGFSTAVLLGLPLVRQAKLDAFLQGASPCWVRPNQPPISSVAGV